MLRALELENFKGIGQRQRIELRPLTLLFGPNSAGKSTILQALLYLREVIEHGSADVDRTELGGGVLELGGFKRLVHRHDQERAIAVRVEFDTPARLDRFNRDLEGFPLADLDDELDGAWIELTIQRQFTVASDGPVVSRVQIGSIGETKPIVQLKLAETRPSTGRVRSLKTFINFEHTLLANLGEDEATALAAWHECSWVQSELFQSGTPDEQKVAGKKRVRKTSNVDHDGRVFAVVSTRHSALPSPNEPLTVTPPNEPTDVDAQLAEVRAFLEMLVVGTTAQLLAALKDALYIGPLRVIPPRGYLYERQGRVGSWADGLAAWDVLLSNNPGFVSNTNKWLDRLGAACSVVVQELRDPSASAAVKQGHTDWSARRLLLRTQDGTLVLPSELGAGISQVVPIIVAAAHSFTRLVLMEQPELHVHPALQVGLGDLFINAVTSAKGRRAIVAETHSEHLILRVLKRIRQTTEHNLPKGVHGFRKDDVSVLYVDSTSKGVRIRQLRIDELGEFIDRWPRGFFEERIGEVF